MNSEGGFTLIEVIVAMMLLGFAMLGAQAMITDNLLRDVGREQARSNARQLVDDQIQLVQAEPRYAELSSRFAGSEDDLQGYPGYVRETAVLARSDHTVVTVAVVTPVWSDTVSGSAIVGIP